MNSNAFLLSVMELQAAQHRLAQELTEAASVDTPSLGEHLLELRSEVLQHFSLKDSFYDTLIMLAHERRDAEAARFAMRTAADMKAQSARVQRFFNDLEVMGPQVRATIFRSLQGGIARRFETELTAAFPLAVRTACLAAQR